MKKHRGLFITFEGGEGSGKSTQIKNAARYLKKSGWKVNVFREPGATLIGEAIRAILLNPRNKNLAYETELLLFLAARAQLMQEKILPALKKGYAVLLDRFEDSTLAYQGFGHRRSLKAIQNFFSFVRGDLVPDQTIYLHVPVSLGMKRAGVRRHGKLDRMEKLNRGFHERVRKGFLTLAKQNPKRIQVIDSSGPVAAVSKKINVRLKNASRK